MEFTVSQVVDGDTFKVSPEWKWQSARGNAVKLNGYDAPARGGVGYYESTDRLRKLILGHKVDLRNCVTIDRLGRLVCDTYLYGRNVLNLFPAS